ncbi:MAG: methyltransferase domain-containing protein [Verrucomicrobia bacterium]|nr:methyltransferase domain-containing protein [Verrucomicrobiota bacterium]
MLESFPLPCWCGFADLQDFAPGYRQCSRCRTLLSEGRVRRRYDKVEDEEEDFYGRNYWFEHQRDQLGLPDLRTRAHTDFIDRYPHWLRLVYDLGLSSGKALELGCGHGGFVYLLRQAGFDAAGLELSPWLADFARRHYEIPVFVGQLSHQKIDPRTYDLVLAFDVLEHLEDPLGTLQLCRKVLKGDGRILLQTPLIPAGASYEALRTSDHPFLKMLMPDEHLFLFPAPALRALLDAAGYAAITEQPSAFPQHDITLSAAAGPSGTRSQAKPEPPPVAAALITLFDTNRALHEHCRAREHDADARLQLLHEAESRLIELEREASDRLALLEQAGSKLIQLERDASDRLALLGKADVELREQISRRQESEQALQEQIILRNESEQAYALASEQWRMLVIGTCNQCLDNLKGLSSRGPLAVLGWLTGRQRKHRDLLAATAEVDELVRLIPAIRQSLERTILAEQRRLAIEGKGGQHDDGTDLPGGLPNTALTPEVLRAHLDAVEKLAVRLVFLRGLLAREANTSLHRQTCTQGGIAARE